MADALTAGQCFAHYLSKWTHHLPAALMVSALVTICHHDLHLLDAIDGYAFFTIGNLTAKDASLERGNTPTVAVVQIDPRSHEDVYRERSPLNRCELKKDLESIYTLPEPPKLLVVDLDLSPALPMDGAAGEADRACEEQLRQLLMVPRSTRTVLMAPFEVLDREGQALIDQWRESLAGAVTFAEPTLKISYGLVNSQACESDSLAAAAFREYAANPAEVNNCLSEKSERLLISPSQYLSGLRAVPLSQLPSRQLDSRRNARTHFEPLYKLPVVFFGSGFGDDDTYLTPVGTMYGVEVHAAAFMSLLQPTSDLKSVLGFVLDIALGLLLGKVIEKSWQRYFALRFSSKARRRQAAPWLILLLAVGLCVLVFLLTVLSFWFLRHVSIWLSPIPIALGMLIESFFNSAVGAAVGEGYEQRQALVRRLHMAHEGGPQAFAAEVARETEQRPHHAHDLQERAERFFYLDFQRLWRSHQYVALALLSVRRVVFFLLLFLLFKILLH
ncbi:CHASE2 domain-containing protein [Pseudomonas sp. NPDC090202]|uniref:CHASE2 domain-containing protein n=1 Tax=unclassified Pseudomonas TaxID=196821 RepID=UPI00382D494C